jgi:CheY-like chemotaxis protein
MTSQSAIDRTPTPARSAVRRNAAGGCRVLVAEDDPAFRELVVARLIDDGYDVEEVDSGSHLLALLRAQDRGLFPSGAPDLLVLDNRMPRMSGLEVLKALRAGDHHVPAILMTAFPMPALRAEAKLLGVPVLSKPFSLDSLSECVLSTLLAQLHADPAVTETP